MGWFDFLTHKKEEDEDMKGFVRLEEDEDVVSAQDMMFQKSYKKKRLSEEVFDGNLDQGTEFDDRLFKQLSGATALDLPIQTIQRAMRLSLLLYRKNVRAFSAVEVVKDFVIGNGVSHKAADPKVQAVLDQHWKMNHWEDKLEERVRSFAIFGEQLYPVFVREKDGLVRISSVSPTKIRGVLRDKDDAEDLVKIAVASGKETAAVNVFSFGEVSDGETKVFDLMRLDDEGNMQGNAFFFALNRISGATRGAPDSLASIDWFEGLDSFIFSLLERGEISQNVVFDLEYQGLNEQELRKRAASFMNSLRSGGVFAHNEKVKLKIQVPDLGADDADKAVSILLRQIQAGTRMSGLFYGDSVDLTKGTATELSMPVGRFMQSRQNKIRRMLTDIFDYQIQESKKAGTLDGVTDFSYEIFMPKILLRDVKMITGALKELSESLTEAVENGWVENDDAGKVYRSLVEQLGSAIDDNTDEVNVKEMVEKEIKKLKEEKAKAAK